MEGLTGLTSLAAQAAPVQEHVQSFVGFTPWELIVCICNTLITYLIIRHFLFKPVRKIMQERADEVQAMYTQAEQNQQEAEALKQEYTGRLASAKTEATDIVKTAQARAVARAEEIEKEATAQAAQMKAKAQEEIAQERKKAMNDMKNEIGGLSVMIASKVIEKDLTLADHERLIETLIDKVG